MYSPPPMDAVILAGGLGTRLRSVVSDMPKCMVPVNGLPFLRYKLLQLHAGGVRRAVLCLGYMAEQIADYFDQNPITGMTLVYALEHELLGTAGGFKNAESLIETENFLALNGDVYLDVDYRALMAQHVRNQAIATLALVAVEDPSRFGLVLFEPNGEITAFLEKQPLESLSPEMTEYYINAGTYCFHRSLLDKIPSGQVCSVERDIFPTLMGQGFYAFPINGYFIDIGTPESFARIQADIETGRLKMPVGV